MFAEFFHMIFADPVGFLQIVWADIVLSGDNALIIGLAASGLAPELQRKAIIFGLVMVAVLRIIFATGTTYLMQVPGLLVAGALLLLWVAWRLYREIRKGIPEEADKVAEDIGHIHEDGGYTGPPTRTLRSALISITIADLSMSTDNVLAVAMIAEDNIPLLVFGLVLSIALMGLAASVIVRLLVRFPIISYLGVALLVYVAAEMLHKGWPDVMMLMGMSAGGHA